MQKDISYTWKPDGSNPKGKYAILGPYRCKVTFPGGQWGVFGRGGGLDAIKSIKTFDDTDLSQPCITTGHYCDISSSVSLLTGGEHHNDRVINAAFLYFPIAGNLVKQSGGRFEHSYSRGPITIGSNVVISMNVTVLSGVTIGDGAVIGAGSVVTKDVPPYAIVAGNPAKVIRYRVAEEYIDDLLRIAWWDWDTSFLAQHMAAIHTMEPKEFIDYCAGLNPPAPTDEGGVLFFSLDRSGEDSALVFNGAEWNGHRIPELPPRFLEYIMQLDEPLSRPVTVCPSLFTQCGLNKA